MGETNMWDGLIGLNDQIKDRDKEILKLKFFIKRMYPFVDSAELYHDFLDVHEEDVARDYMKSIKEIAEEK